MKTDKEIEEKYEELNKKMQDNLPTKDDLTMLRSVVKDGASAVDVMALMHSRSIDSISIDAQRYALEWVMNHHD